MSPSLHRCKYSGRTAKTPSINHHYIVARTPADQQKHHLSTILTSL
ncbi:hypothetical protein I3271_00900 [Photobacterium leiognathi]|nr:hypothetical protein [Photobacterium leiognathi]MCG3883240.1 hypothetical protein [Photobacterium leiognathi]